MGKDKDLGKRKDLAGHPALIINSGSTIGKGNEE